MNKVISVILAILLMASAMPLVTAQEITEAEIPRLSVTIVERELINGTTGEPEPTVLTAQVLGERRIGPGTYRKVDIVIKNVDAELPMPAGKLFGAILNTNKVADPGWFETVPEFWIYKVGDRIPTGTMLELLAHSWVSDTGLDMKVSTTVPEASWLREESTLHNEEFVLDTERILPGETITKTVYVFAYDNAVVGETFDFRVILTTYSLLWGGTIVAVTDHTFELDFPTIDMLLVVGVVLIFSILVAKWRDVI